MKRAFVRVLCWALALLPALWVLNLAAFCLRASAIVQEPRFQSPHWRRTEAPSTWPDPKNLDMPFHHGSVSLLFLLVLFGTLFVLREVLILSRNLRSSEVTALLRTRLATMSLLVAAVILCWPYVSWYLD